MTNQHFNEEHLHGSAHFSCYRDIRNAGLFVKDGLPLGHFENRQLRLKSDGAILTIAGAGGGKTAALLGWTCCQPNNMPMIVLGPRGELAAVSRASISRQGIHGYYWNPKRFHGLPSHSINPLAEITLESPHLHSDAQVVARDLIAQKTGDNSYFANRAREWQGALIKFRVEYDGMVSLPSLYRMINKIEGNPLAWADELEAMLRSRFEDVRRTANEMLVKQQDAPKEFGAILGTIYEAFAFLHDPDLRGALEGGDCKLSDLIDNPQTIRIELMPPAEVISLWSPVLRLMFSRVMTLKARAPQARRVLMIVDEAGQLGKADFLLSAFTFSRGAGVIVHALFQDIGQIKRNFGAEGVISFLGSAVARQFFGIRDFETARLVSNMLGEETLFFNDGAAQARAAMEARWRAHAILNGEDPFEHGRDYAHYQAEAHRRSKMRRPLMSPDEILNMPEDRQILFIAGRDLHPIYAHKYRYFERREMAGFYLPNPFHPPLDRVKVKGRLWSKWLPIKKVSIPDRYRQYPQHRGQRFVEQIGNYSI